MGDTTDQVITPIRKVDARFSHAGDYTTNKIYCGKYSGRAGEVDLCGILYAQLWYTIRPIDAGVAEWQTQRT